MTVQRNAAVARLKRQKVRQAGELTRKVLARLHGRKTAKAPRSEWYRRGQEWAASTGNYETLSDWDTQLVQLDSAVDILEYRRRCNDIRRFGLGGRKRAIAQARQLLCESVDLAGSVPALPDNETKLEFARGAVAFYRDTISE